MAINYYDDAIAQKLQQWVPDDAKIRILKPDETKKLFELVADDKNDKKIKLPLIALSRNTDIELSINLKNPQSFDGVRLKKGTDSTLLLNVLPIKTSYQMDIYTKKQEEADEYVRTFLFKLINNPMIRIDIPYNGNEINHVAYIRVLPTVADTSAISERLFSGQFYRWTIQMELQDAYLFNMPYKPNWKINGACLEISKDIKSDGEIEALFE